MVSLFFSLILMAVIPAPTTLVREVTRVYFIHRLIQDNSGPALTALDRAYSGMRDEARAVADSKKQEAFIHGQLLQSIAGYKVLNAPGALMRTPDSALRMQAALRLTLPEMVRGAESYAAISKDAKTRAFLSVIRAANASATALWVQAENRLLYDGLLRLGIDKMRDLEKVLSSASKKGDRAAALLLERVRRKTAFSFVKHGLANPMVGSVVLRGFGLKRDAKYPVRIAGPGIVLSKSGHETRNIRAVTEGMVIFASRIRGLGLTVIIDHTRGLRSVYAGLATTDVKVNDMVVAGSVLGQVPCTGGRCLLFFALENRGRWTDPTVFIAAGGGVK